MPFVARELSAEVCCDPRLLRVSTVPGKCEIAKHGALDRHDGCVQANVLRDIVDHPVLMLQPAVRPERRGPHAEYPCGEELIRPQQLDENERLKQTLVSGFQREGLQESAVSMPSSSIFAANAFVSCETSTQVLSG